jgi:hypothetical protein
LEPRDAEHVGERQRIAVIGREQRDVLGDAQPVGHAAGLQHHAGARTEGVLTRIPAEHRNGAAVGRRQTQQQTNSRRLTGAVGAEKREQLSAPERQRHVVEGGRVSKPLGHGCELCDDFAGHLRTSAT